MLQKTNYDWILEQKNLIEVFKIIANKEDIDFFNIKNSDKVNLEINYKDIFIKNAIRQNFIINIYEFAEFNQSEIKKRIKNLSTQEIKKLLAISAYNSLLADLLNKNNLHHI